MTFISRVRGRIRPGPTISMPLVALLLAGATLELPAQSRGLPLWEVSRGDHSIHLLGSVHVLRPDAYPLDQALYDAFDAARVMAFEVDLGSVPEAALQMISRGMQPTGGSLRSAIPADLYAELERQVDALGVPIQALDAMEPWLVALSINSMVLQRAGFEARLGVDMHFHERGIEQGKPVVALESIDEQIAIFDGLSDDEQVALLRASLDELEVARERMDRITDVWANGDIEQLAAMMNESMAGNPMLLDRILYQRNRNWIPRIEELIESGEPAIVIVGLGHMVGRGSVTDLLAERGYEVRRVVPAAAR